MVSIDNETGKKIAQKLHDAFREISKEICSVDGMRVIADGCFIVWHTEDSRVIVSILGNIKPWHVVGAVTAELEEAISAKKENATCG